VPSSASSEAEEMVRCRFDELRNRIVSTDLIGLFLSANWTLVGGMRSVAGGVGTCLRAGSPELCFGATLGSEGRRARGVSSSLSVSAFRRPPAEDDGGGPLEPWDGRSTFGSARPDLEASGWRGVGVLFEDPFSAVEDD
jgi:hypothetical protein